jgi:putative PIN family toxin of toxin-antitoxin system
VRIVLDTNVTVSALIWGGTPYRLLQGAADGDLVLYTSPTLLDELRAVLAREHLASRLQEQRSSVEQAITLYSALAIGVSPTATPRVVPGDADDDHVIATAVAAAADFLVTGDRHLLTIGQHQGVRIVTPADAVRLISLL